MDNLFFRIIEQNMDLRYLSHQNSKGVTALSIACQFGHEEYVKVLINHGCDVNQPNSNGSTPILQASHFGNSFRVLDLTFSCKYRQRIDCKVVNST